VKRDNPESPERSRRSLAREMRTLTVMVRLYCARFHAVDRGEAPLCDACNALLRYAEQRIARCPYGVDKPPCQDCPVHCFQPEQRRRIQAVMRWSGPRMLWRHPLLTWFHLRESRRSRRRAQERDQGA